MKLNYMTLDGKVDKEQFLREWDASSDRDATYLQTKDAVFMMPYGQYGSDADKDKKFGCTYRRHTFVVRDFEIKDLILGGGYLKLSADKSTCSYGYASTDFGIGPDSSLIVKIVNEFFFDPQF